MIKITSDSTADLDYLFTQHNISVMPLYVMLDGQGYRDGVTITPPMIFDKYEEKKILPKTSAVGPEEYAEFFKKNGADDCEIIHFCISNELSASFNNAKLAAQQFKGVYTIDSRTLSSGIGLLALKAMDMIAEGKPAKEIAAAVTELAKCPQTSFMVHTMEFLHKGGRCSSLTRIIAGILRIKPVLQIIDGKIEVGRKYLGSFEKNLERYVEETFKLYDNPDYSRIFITHTCCDEKTVDLVKQHIRHFAPRFKEIIETRAGATITSHCGKGTLGILYINKA